MAENKQNENLNTFIKEEIDSSEKKVTKSSKIGRIVGIVLCLAVMFGIIAGVFYAISSRVIEYVNEKQDESSRTHVDVVNPGEPTITIVPDGTTVMDVSGLAANVQNAIISVQLQTEKSDGIFSEPIKGYENVSSVLVADDGNNFYLLTDSEGIEEVKKIFVAFGDTIIDGRLLGTADALNLAVIVVNYRNHITDEQKAEYKVLKFAKEDSISLGTPVMAIGSPNGVHNSIDYGIVTSGGNYSGVADMRVEVMTSNMAYYKNGRGLVINANEEICGIILNQTKADAVFSFVNTTTINSWIEKMINEGSLPYAGIHIEELKEEDKTEAISKGVFVNSVELGSPAEKAGVRAGDIIVSADDIPITSVSEYTNALFAHKAKETFLVKVMRDGMERLATIKTK